MSALGNNANIKKTISVSSKRQITIPLQFYKHLEIENEVECSLENGSIVLRPTHKGTAEFSVEILKELIDKGYSGEELLKQFKMQDKKIKNAITHLLEDADAIAAGEKPSATVDDIFRTN